MVLSIRKNFLVLNPQLSARCKNYILGSLSYCAKGNLSILAGFIIGVISYYIKDFWGLERDFLAKMSVLSGHFLLNILQLFE